jgi:hypothetical protein
METRLTLKVSSKIRKIQCELIGDALLCHSKHFTPLPKCMEENLRLEHPHTQVIHSFNHWVKLMFSQCPHLTRQFIAISGVVLPYHAKRGWRKLQRRLGGGRFQFGRSRCFFEGRCLEHTLNGAIVRGHHDTAASQRTCSGKLNCLLIRVVYLVEDVCSSRREQSEAHALSIPM